jgi:3-dehydroquinate dehydratase-1
VLEELLKRIDGLERRLGENEGTNGTAQSPTTEPSNTSSTASRKRQAVSPPEDMSEPSPSAIVIVSTPPACVPTTATDEQLVRKLVDIFFQRCDGKPYTLFHEGLFRQQWAEGRVPDHIIDTLCAVAIRFVIWDVAVIISQVVTTSHRYTPAHELGTLSAQEYSEQFAARARRGVDSDEPSLENLQSMLLLSMTYYAMGYGKKSFMQMGAIVRTPHFRSQADPARPRHPHDSRTRSPPGIAAFSSRDPTRARNPSPRFLDMLSDGPLHRLWVCPSTLFLRSFNIPAAALH